MDWDTAVQEMRKGHRVRRASESNNDVVMLRVGDETPAHQSGVEPIYLAAAWTDTDQPVRVFRGAWSNSDFIPGKTERMANDWQIED